VEAELLDEHQRRWQSFSRMSVGAGERVGEEKRGGGAAVMGKKRGGRVRVRV
jgi:hypothetical protein